MAISKTPSSQQKCDLAVFRFLFILGETDRAATTANMVHAGRWEPTDRTPTMEALLFSSS